jgi:hypothetical protein
MKTKILIFFAFFSFDIYCQTIKPDVIASSGGSGNNEQISMSWTLGETFIYEYSNNDLTLSQGFHQNFTSVPTYIDESLLPVDIIASPNPVNDLLSVIINNNTSAGEWKIEIFDARGLLVSSLKSTQASLEIDFSSYVNGTYLVRISKNNLSKTFHIIKNESSHEKN